MNVLALDSAPNNTGWAIGSVVMKAPTADRFRLKPWADDEGARQFEFVMWLKETIVQNHVERVFYEKLYPIFSPRDMATRESQSKRNTSGFKGAHWSKAANGWCARICRNRTQIHLGVFPTRELAASAYEEAARRLFGRFSRVE